MTDRAAERSDRISRASAVGLVGGGPVPARDLAVLVAHSGTIVAADGGANRLAELGLVPDRVIGDMDSIDAGVRARLSPGRVLHVTDQDSTDFEKCLTRIDAPLILAAGFAGGRMDHFLAVMRGLVRHPARRCVILGPDDAGVLLPPEINLPLDPGTTVSLFPMCRARASSSGLEWPLDAVDFDPAGAIGTSNRARGPVRLTTPQPGLLLFVPRDSLPILLAALDAAPRW